MDNTGEKKGFEKREDKRGAKQKRSSAQSQPAGKYSQALDKNMKLIFQEAAPQLLELLFNVKFSRLLPKDRELVRLEASRKHLDFLAEVVPKAKHQY